MLFKADDRFLYCDEYCAVVNKHIGEVCENDAASSDPDSLIRHVLDELKNKTSGTFSYACAVHRLDKPVSGCAIIAFSKQAAADLSAMFKNRTAVKKYWAAVEHPDCGICAQEASSGVLRDCLVYSSPKRKSFIVPVDSSHAVNAELEWHRVGTGVSYAFIEVTLHSGKTHQIRAQLSHAGNPVKGDVKYGARRNEKNGGIRLHAHSLSFVHPVTGDTIFVEAPVPYVDPLWQAFSNAAGGTAEK